MTLIALGLFSVGFTSCSSNDDDVSTATETSENRRIEAVQEFGESFAGSFEEILATRSIVDNAPIEENDSIIEIAGRKICDELTVPTNRLLAGFGITDADIEEAYKECENEFDAPVPLNALKCYTALCIYDTYKHSVQTRADIIDIAACAVVGSTVKDLFKMPTKEIAKFAVKKLASKLVPYVGWGWAVASATYCLSKL